VRSHEGTVTVRRWMRPRDVAVASRTMIGLTGAACFATVLVMPLNSTGALDSVPTTIATTALMLLGIAGCLLLSRRPDAGSPVWTVLPPAAIVILVAGNLLARDASTGAQLLLVFPVLYGSSCLPRHGAAVMTTGSVVGVFVTAVSLLPLRVALTDVGVISVALVTTAVLLVRAHERHALLVARLEEQASVDPLTGLVTRRVLADSAAAALEGAGPGVETSLLLLDLDGFKGVNDSQGHPAGDAVLVALAQVLRRRCRQQDVVCRIGGDEIALLLPGCSLEVATQRCEQILGDVREHVFVLPGGRGSLRTTVSIGAAHVVAPAGGFRDLYAAADLALYEAKRAGRDRYRAAVPGPDPVADTVTDEVPSPAA